MSDEVDEMSAGSRGSACTLVCWACGKAKNIVATAPPQFAFEVASWANDVGWVGAMDTLRGRSLVFCGKECCEASRTKSGAFRARPKVVA